MKIVLKNGSILEGKYISLDDKEARMKTGGMEKAYPLTDVVNVMAKESKAAKFALAFGGGCCAIGTVSVLASDTEDSEYSTGELMAGVAIWTVLFAAGGLLIGKAVEDWDTVYVGTDQSSFISSLDLVLDLDRNGNVKCGLSYGF